MKITQYSQNFLDKNQLTKLNINRFFFFSFSLIIFFVSLILLFPSTLFSKIRTGLDPSYLIGFHLAKHYNFIFGKDIIFTYGPLGYFIAKLPIYVSKYQFFLLDTFLFANTVFVLHFSFKRLKSYLSVTLLFFCVLLLGSLWINPSHLEKYVYLLQVFMLLHFVSLGNIATLFLAMILTVFGFYLKLNTGIFMMISMGTFFFFGLIFPQKYSRKSIISFVLLFLSLLIISTLILNVNIVGYLTGGYHISNSFIDAMFFENSELPHHGREHFYMVLTVILSYFALFIIDYKEVIREKNLLLMYLITGLFIIAMYKITFSRFGQYHVFYVFVPPSIGFLYLFTKSKLKDHLSKILIIAIMFSFASRNEFYKPEFFKNKLLSINKYFMTVIDSNYLKFDNSNLDHVRLPENILKKIGTETVDVLPWEISYIYANDLNYNPRPIIQSYSAYDYYLDTKNFQKYTSDDAPEYLLFSVEDIDGRHPFFTESKTKRAILTHYKLEERINDVLLLKRRNNPMKTIESTQSIKVGNLNEFIDIDKVDDLTYMTADIQYDLIGKLVRSIYVPPRLLVTIKFDDGQEHTYKAIKPIINGEVLVNKFVDLLNSAEYFINFGGKFNKNVDQIKFHSPHNWGYKPEFSYQFKNIHLDSNKLEKLEVINLPFSDEVKLLGLDLKEITPDSILIDLFWACKLKPNMSGRPYLAEISLTWEGEIALSDVLKPFSCSTESEELITTNHRILLDSKMPPGDINLVVNLLYDDNGQLIVEGSTTIEHIYSIE